MGKHMTGWSETWRVLAYTLALAIAFVALGRLQLGLFGGLTSAGLVTTSTISDAELARQAQQVAEQSRGVLQRLPPGHRLGVFRMGYGLGYASALVGAALPSDEARKQQLLRAAEWHVGQSAEMAVRLGIPPESMPAVASLKDLGTLNARLEADDNGSAARVGQQLSVLHRHLYLLGAHVGTEAARVEITAGQVSSPAADLIRQHAMLAGIAPALWQPLAMEPQGETAAQVLGRYRNALAAMRTALDQMP